MRFIRKGGRVIPIRTEEEQGHRTKAIAGAAGSGVAVGTALAGIKEAGTHLIRSKIYARAGQGLKSAQSLKTASKFLKFGAATYVGGAIGGSIYSGLHQRDAEKIRKTGGVESFKEGAKQIGAMALGGLASYGAYKGIIAGGMKVAPTVKKVAEAIRFARAKKVASTIYRPIKGLLK